MARVKVPRPENHSAESQSAESQNAKSQNAESQIVRPLESQNDENQSAESQIAWEANGERQSARVKMRESSVATPTGRYDLQKLRGVSYLAKTESGWTCCWENTGQFCYWKTETAADRPY